MTKIFHFKPMVTTIVIFHLTSVNDEKGIQKLIAKTIFQHGVI